MQGARRRRGRRNDNDFRAKREEKKNKTKRATYTTHTLHTLHTHKRPYTRTKKKKTFEFSFFYTCRESGPFHLLPDVHTCVATCSISSQTFKLLLLLPPSSFLYHFLYHFHTKTTTVFSCCNYCFCFGTSSQKLSQSDAGTSMPPNEPPLPS